MRRDPNLVRDALLMIEGLDIPAGATMLYYVGENGFVVDGNSNDAVSQHLIWLIEGGYINGESQNGAFVIRSLSWDGCEFLDKVRDPEIWSTAKDGAKKVGSWSVGLLADLAKTAIVAKAHSLGLPIGA
jgi:hypothetical protein